MLCTYVWLDKKSFSFGIGGRHRFHYIRNILTVLTYTFPDSIERRCSVCPVDLIRTTYKYRLKRCISPFLKWHTYFRLWFFMRRGETWASDIKQHKSCRHPRPVVSKSYHPHTFFISSRCGKTFIEKLNCIHYITLNNSLARFTHEASGTPPSPLPSQVWSVC